MMALAPPPAPPSTGPSAPPPTKSAAEQKPPVALPAVQKGPIKKHQRTVIYGAGGVGKTTLASMVRLVGLKALFLDLESGSSELDIARIPIENFDQLRAAIQNRELTGEYDVVVVDNFTKAEEMAGEWMIRNIPHEKGSAHKIERIEDYGWGKGYQHLFDTFMYMLADLDVLARTKHVVGICHICPEKVPNPAGDDFLQYQPRLYPGGGKGSNNIRARVREWADHLLYIEMDKYVNDAGKAQGTGSRTIYPVELPHFWAKSRSLTITYPFNLNDATIWKHLFKL